MKVLIVDDHALFRVGPQYSGELAIHFSYPHPLGTCLIVIKECITINSLIVYE